MCDDQTEADNEQYLRERGLGRRTVGLGAGATVATLLAGCERGPQAPPTTAPEPNPPTTDPPTEDAAPGRTVTIDTPDGAAEAFFAAPGQGRHPAVLIWPDIAGLRGAFVAMATRLAAAGYAVLAVNHYYRSSKLPILETFDEWRTDEGKQRIAPMRKALTPQAITSDAAAFIAWLDAQDQVDPARKIGTTGYCMGGPFTFRTAAAVPDRVGVIGSFHGGGLVTDAPDSPHALLPGVKAAALVCVARNDDERDPEAKTALKQAADAAGVTAEIEVYPAQHGWCVTDSPVYDEVQAERAWSRLTANLEAHL